MIEVSQSQFILIIVEIIVGGFVIGSFLNAVIARLKSEESIFFARSHCLSCKREILWYDLFPIVSFLFLAGRCRFCKNKISLQYPFVELGTGLLFGLVAWRFLGSPFDVVFWLFFIASFVIIAVYDLKFQMIPNEIVWPLVAGAVLYKILPFLTNRLLTTHYSLLTALITGGFIAFLVIITRERAMGAGDIPIAALQGLLLGFPKGIYALFLSFLLGALVGVFLLAVKRGNMKTAVPFTPFLIGSLLIMLFI